ncbi:Type I secretion membrane fusion protein, HlyD family (plasmid) [Neorhizobium galegae bv. officinalis bv. officinalis str. HAMBI 1141]|uniref:Membrane fusion protein (MFP) family protein n=2 Tax=Neorhizobium galegae TaxID=399 RepID=A0A068TJF7_NEOGA|nr:Type I secretion membrane fusion protein, HlyD family [Neorhizobium galegae bv. officinalis bv. officinalis str. HAMBI 1141]
MTNDASISQNNGAMVQDYAPVAERSIRRLTLVAFATIFLLFGVLGGLAATVHLRGAVIASGTLVVDSYVKTIRHQSGGTVSDVFVKNGDRVLAGQLLVHLNDIQHRANLAVICKRLKELSARIARLLAERDSKEVIDFPKSFFSHQGNVEVAKIIEGEQRLFNDRRASRAGRKAQLIERLNQLSKQAEGLSAQQDGKRGAVSLVKKELASLQSLFERGVIPATRVYALQRDAADLTGDLGSLIASTAEITEKMAETKLQIIQIDDDQRTEISDQLRQAESEVGEYSERMVAARDELQHVDIRAPQAGTVHQLTVHAVGAVVTPGETIMQIVPSSDAFTAELKLAPQDIDQVAVGQDVRLRFSAFSQNTTPQMNGRVTDIAADLTTDQRTGQGYYTLRVHIPQEEWARVGKLTPVPGMPVEAFIQTSERTALAYLVKPLADQVARAFREE